VANYRHPSKFGQEDICRMWTADNFDPDNLISLYKKAGAKYFMSMGVHHDNLDLWNLKHQPRWNSVATGPKKDVVGFWRNAAYKHGSRFAVSENLSNCYNRLAVSHLSDRTGPKAGVSYDATRNISISITTLLPNTCTLLRRRPPRGEWEPVPGLRDLRDD